MTYNNKKLALIAMYLSLSIVMEYFKQFVPLLEMPLGGAIEFPLIILVASLHLGVYLGGCLVLVFWFITTILGLTYPPVTPIQYLLDYIIPSDDCCWFLRIIYASKIVWIASGYQNRVSIILMMVIRYVCNLISGAYFYFPNNTVAGSIPAWINSIAYNTSYNFSYFNYLDDYCSDYFST